MPRVYLSNRLHGSRFPQHFARPFVSLLLFRPIIRWHATVLILQFKASFLLHLWIILTYSHSDLLHNLLSFYIVFWWLYPFVHVRISITGFSLHSFLCIYLLDDIFGILMCFLSLASIWLGPSGTYTLIHQINLKKNKQKKQKELWLSELIFLFDVYSLIVGMPMVKNILLSKPVFRLLLLYQCK